MSYTYVIGLLLLFSSVSMATYFLSDYYMDSHWPVLFGQICGENIQDDSMYLHSHLNTLGFFKYGNNINCTIQLDAGKQKGARYKLAFNRFDVEPGTATCKNDYLAVTGNKMSVVAALKAATKYCGTRAPNVSALTVQQYLALKFTTNAVNGFAGFKILATRNLPSPCLKDYFLCKSEKRCIDIRLKCDGTSHCNDGVDEASCTSMEKMVGSFAALGISGLVIIAVGVGCVCTCMNVVLCVCCCCQRQCECCCPCCPRFRQNGLQNRGGRRMGHGKPGRDGKADGNRTIQYTNVVLKNDEFD